MITKEERDIIKGLRADIYERQRKEIELFRMFQYLIYWGTKEQNLSYDDSAEAYIDTMHITIINIVNGKYEERNESTLKSYIIKIFKNKCIDSHRKKEVRTGPLTGSLSDNLPELLKSNIEARIAKMDYRKKLDQCFGKAGLHCKELLMLVIEDYQDKEIAQIMKYKSADVAKQSRYDCFRKVKDCLGLQSALYKRTENE